MIYKNKNVNKIYRVLPHLNSDNDFPRDSKSEIDSSYDDYYIPCTRVNAEIYTTQDIYDGKEIFVAYIPSRGVRDDLINNLSQYIIKEVNNDADKISSVKPKGGSYESELYFYDCDIVHFAKLLKARTKGRTIRPDSKENLPHEIIKYKKYNDMPKGWFDDFKSEYSIPIQQNEGIKVSLVWNVIYVDFGKSIGRNLVNEAKLNGYKNSHFIHQQGLWDTFEEYLTNRKENGVK